MGFEAISSTIFGFSQLSQKKKRRSASEIFTGTTLQEYQEQEPQLVVDIHLCKDDERKRQAGWTGRLSERRFKRQKKGNAEEKKSSRTWKKLGIFKINYSHFFWDLYFWVFRSKKIHVVRRTHVPSLKNV